MTPQSFWISEDGIITSCREIQEANTLELTITFRLRNSDEVDLAREFRPQLQFSERSTIARLGMEINAPKPPRINKDRLILTARAHVYDTSFPCTPFFKDLLKPGVTAGRLFYAPESQKLSADEI